MSWTPEQRDLSRAMPRNMISMPPGIGRISPLAKGVDDGRRHSLVMIVTRLSQPESIRGNFAAPRPGYALKKPAVLAKEWAASTCGANQVSCETAADGMFLRLKTRCKDCKQQRCWSIVEKRRVSGGRTVQRLLEHVGLLRLIGRPPTK